MENPGKIVKKIAIALFVIMVILSIILARYVGDELPDRTEAIGMISAFIIGVAVSACFSVLIYAFGDLVEKTSDTNTVVRKIESYTRNLKITYQDEQATEESTKREPELKEQQEAAARAKREVKERAKWQEENKSQNYELSDDDFIDITCPKCGEMLSFLKNETKVICPECGAEFEI